MLKEITTIDLANETERLEKVNSRALSWGNQSKDIKQLLCMNYALLGYINELREEINKIKSNLKII